VLCGHMRIVATSPPRNHPWSSRVCGGLCGHSRGHVPALQHSRSAIQGFHRPSHPKASIWSSPWHHGPYPPATADAAHWSLGPVVANSGALRGAGFRRPPFRQPRIIGTPRSAFGSLGRTCVSTRTLFGSLLDSHKDSWQTLEMVAHFVLQSHSMTPGSRGALIITFVRHAGWAGPEAPNPSHPHAGSRICQGATCTSYHKCADDEAPPLVTRVGQGPRHVGLVTRSPYCILIN